MADVEFIATTQTLHWIGHYLDQGGDRTALFRQFEAAAMQTLERIAADRSRPTQEIELAIRAGQRLQGMFELACEAVVVRHEDETFS